MKWIKTKDLLPDDYCTVIYCMYESKYKEASITAGYRYKKKWFYYDGEEIPKPWKVTHWMLFPRYPKELEQYGIP